MARSSARITGDRRVRQLLSEMRDRTTGVPAPVWRRVGDTIAAWMTDQFYTEGVALTGRPWAPLNPDYLAWKARVGLPTARLHRTLAMRRSFTSRPMAVETYAPMSARFGSDDPKAAFHQYGTRFMPQRKIMEADVNPDFADDVNSVLARYIFEERL